MDVSVTELIVGTMERTSRKGENVEIDQRAEDGILGKKSIF